MEPASVYSFSRSRYTSASWSSSIRPTLVSCGVEDTNNSLVIRTPVPSHMAGCFTGTRRKAEGKERRKRYPFFASTKNVADPKQLLWAELAAETRKSFPRSHCARGCDRSLDRRPYSITLAGSLAGLLLDLGYAPRLPSSPRWGALRGPFPPRCACTSILPGC